MDELTRIAERFPHKTALAMADGHERLGFGELDCAANAIATQLRQTGIEEGDTIALLLENHVSVVAWWWGARRAGVYYVPVGTRMLAGEIAYVLEDSGSRLLVASEELAEVAQAAVAGTDIPVMTATIDLASAPPDPVHSTVIGREMIYSSGTTGRPKGIRRPLARAGDATVPELERKMRTIFGYDAQTVYLSASPLYHATGRFLNRVLEAGGTVVVLPRFDPEGALAAIEKHRITHTQWVPTMFRRMLDLPEAVRDRYDLSSLRAALHAAAPCPVSLKRAMIDWWGPIVHEYYGGTENAGVTFIEADDWLRHPGSVGRTIAGKIHILDPDNPHRELPPGEIGMIMFESGVPFRYTLPGGGHGDNTSPQGYTGYGDVGHVDAQGYLYISDRRDDLILSGGVNIYPQEIEAAIETHPDVREVAVIGVPDRDLGQKVCAVVVPRQGNHDKLEENIAAYARTQLSSIKTPRKIVITDSLPRNETGKLLKRVLRDHYAEVSRHER